MLWGFKAVRLFRVLAFLGLKMVRAFRVFGYYLNPMPSNWALNLTTTPQRFRV